MDKIEYCKHIDLDYYNNKASPIPLILYPHKSSPRINYDGDVTDTHIKFGSSEYGRFIFEKFNHEDDYNLLLSFAIMHGRFLEKFFRSELNLRIRKGFIENKYDFEDYKDIYSQFYHREINTIVFKYFIADVAFDFYKVSLYKLIDEKIYEEIINWENRNIHDKKCEICGNAFNVLKLPDWVYYGSNGNVDICFECPIPKTPTKQNMINLIPQLIKSCNFIPNSDFGIINHSFTSKIEKERWIDVAKIIIQMGVTGFTNENIKSLFGSWFVALVESKVLDNNILKTGRGVKCIGKSGNVCNSLDEMFIDNWLYDNGLKTVKEPFYPFHEKYNPKSLRRADWYINGYYIEYFGLAGDEKYDMKSKHSANPV